MADQKISAMPAMTALTGTEEFAGVQTAGVNSVATPAQILTYALANGAATDSLVVHRAGTETITGAKTFTGSMLHVAPGAIGFDLKNTEGSAYTWKLQPQISDISYDGFSVVLPDATVGLSLTPAGVLAAKSTITSAGNTVLTNAVYTVGTLPAGSAGDRAYVTDANATTFNSTVAGGGANVVPVFKNATVWVIA